MTVVVVGSTDVAGRTAVAGLLRGVGHTVIETATGEAVLAAVRQHGAQVVLVDDSSTYHDTGTPGGGRWRIDGLQPAQLLDCVEALSPGADRAGDAYRAQAQLAAIVQSSHDAIIGKTLGGRITSWNPGAERLYGYTAAEIIGQSARILFPPEQQRDEAEILQRISAGERVEQYQTQRVRRDGSRVTVSLTVSPITDQQGRIIGAASVSRGIGGSGRVQAELAAIVRSSHDAIMGKTLGGRITSWNPGAERLYGYTAAEIIGQQARVLFPAERRSDEAEILQRISAGERVEQYQTQRVRKDGSRVTVSLTVSPITDEWGRIIGAASVSRGMDPQQEAEARFRGLLDAAPDSIICVDVAGMIVLVNAQAERLLGYRRRELLARPVELIIPGGVHGGPAEHLPTTVGDPAAASLHPTIRRSDGTLFPADISLSAFDTSTGVVLSVAIRDATERLQAQAERERLSAQAEREGLERQLHQVQRLESLGQLAGGVAHDFNNMLGIILNYLAFIQEELAAAAHGDHRRDWAAVCADAEQVKRAAERAAALTHQLLAFARREVVRPRVLDLNTIVAGIEPMLRRTLGEHVQLITDQAPDLGRVLIDPGQIEQVLVNLAVNARDAMPHGGTLTITTRNPAPDDLTVHDPPVAPGRYACLQVADTGAGIPKDVLERVFEPFFTTKPSGQGTGLGLATAYGAIAQAGGHLRISSEVDVGTVVTALLPVTEQSAQSSAVPPAHERLSGEGTILVVEDEDGIREVVRRLLTRNGYQVITAASGPDAIDKVRWYDGGIDLLLTDVVMPHMLGKEVAEKIQSLRPGIRVLYMSGYAQPVLSSHGSLDPGIGLIEKPFTEPDLIGSIRELLDTDGPGN